MSDAGAAAAHATHEEHHELGFIRTYIFSTDHKMIGRQFLLSAVVMLIFGGLIAMMMRWELAWPETPVPFTSWISEPFMYAEPEHGLYGAYMDPAFYNSLFTMHATIMIFFVVMPFLIGGFGNFLIPLMIGAGDMAFPLLNLLSFWTAVPAIGLILYSFFVEGGAAAGGWTMYATLSAVSTGSASSNKIAVMNKDQITKGRRNQVIPGARILMIVVI